MARAYRELERAGLIVTRGRHGTFVHHCPATTRRTAELADAAQGFAIRARQLGAEPAEALAQVQETLDRLTPMR